MQACRAHATVLVVTAVVLSLAACSGSEVSGNLSADTTWSSAQPTVLVAGDLTVPRGVTLTVEPGVRVLFAADATLTVHGRLVAEGTADRPITFDGRGRTPAAWDGLRFESSEADNRLVHVDLRGASGSSRAVLVEQSRLLLDHVHLAASGVDGLELRGPDVIIRDCEFADPGHGQIIHGKASRTKARLVVERSVFRASGGGDIIDYRGAKRPGPILQVLDSRFLGGEDDAIDLDGNDARIEGNLFTGFHAGASASGTSNAISANDGADVLLARNVFVDNDCAVLVKNGAFARLEHVTIVDSTIAAIRFDEPGRAERPGRGVDIEASILWDNAVTFAHLRPDTRLNVRDSIVPGQHVGLGPGNLASDPRLTGEGFELRPHPASPAAGRGAR